MMGITLTYDGTYDGLLSAIFETFRLKIKVDSIVPIMHYQDSLFAEPIHVATKIEWSKRVQKGIIKKSGKSAAQLLYRCFLSERKDIELLILHFVQTAMTHQGNVEHNYRDEKILALHKINKQIGREVHRMHAFVRFQKTKDAIYTALINPDFNVLPLIGDHFEKRYPAMQWLIYDTHRRYGIFYDCTKISYITFAESEHQHLKTLAKEIQAVEESDYQELWKTYFKSVNIPERNNRKLHLQHVPKRYWKYLTEK